MKKLITLLLLISVFASVFASIVVSADFGSGTTVMTNETKLIKSALFGKKIVFSELDIKQGLCISDFKSITITEIPLSSEGTLMLAGRRVSNGQTIKRKNLSSLVFIPASADTESASFKFKVDSMADAKELVFLLRFCDKINYEPTINDEYLSTLSIRTQRDIGIYGTLMASDKEGDELEYIILSYPKGTLTLSEDGSGDYHYIPKKNFLGSDSFTFVVRDEWGNFSTPATVTVTVDERMCETVYTDMKNRAEYNAAVAMTAMGIMSGNVVGDNNYFNPDGTVTRAEFVSMAMKALGIRVDTTLEGTYFDDNGDIPSALVGYIATAQRTGIINGSFKDGALLFRANDAITKYEAAMILANITRGELSGQIPVFSDIDAVPSYARNDVYVMYSMGIFESENGMIDATSTVSRAECAEYIYRILMQKSA